NSDDIQAVGSDTRPPMLDRTDYDSWPRTDDNLNDNDKKRFDDDDNVKMLLARSELTKEDRESQLYNEFERFKMLPGENINEYYVRFHKLVNDMRNIRMTMPNIQLNSKFVNNMSPDRIGLYTQTDEILDTLTKQVAFLAQSFRVNLPQTNNQLRTSSNTRNQATVQDGRVVVQNVQGRQNQNQRNFARGAGAAGNGGAQNRAGNANAGQGKPIKCYNCNGLRHIARNCTQPKHPQNFDYFKDKMLLMQAQENGAVLDEEELLFLAGEQTNTFDADVDNQPVRDLALNEDNIFQADECDAFDSDVDDEPTAQSIFMASLSSAGPVNLQAGPSNASILSEVHDLDNAIDPSNNDQVEHEIHNEVQQKNVIDSTSADMGNSNVIPYEQYLTVNDVSVVPSSASSVPNDAYVLHDNDAYVPHDPLATELNIYKEQVVMYEQRAKFELTLREQKMDEQMSILIRDRNKKEESLKKELHFVKLQLNSTIQNNKINEETEKKAEDLKARTPTLLVLPPAIVYPPNTPVHLVRLTLPTTSQVNIGLFENLEAEVDQNAIAIKSGKIERKNLLITNETLIANCIAQDVFYTVIDSVMNASRFHELSTAYNVAMNRAIDLEAENSKLLEKIQNDDHNTMRNNRGVHHGYLNRLRDTLDTLREIVEDSRNNRPSDNSLEYACVYTKHSQELLEYVNASCPNVDNKRDKFIATTPLTRKKHVTFADPLETSGVSTATTARRSQPKSNTKHDKTFPTISVPKKNVEDHHRTNKSKLSKKNRVNLSISPTGRLLSLGGLCPLVRPTALNCGTKLDDPQENNTHVEYNLVCSNQQDPNYNWGSNVSNSPLPSLFKCRTVRFGNNHFGSIMGYGDYVIGDSVISRLWQNLYTISVEDMMRSSPICLLSKASKNKSWLWHRRLNHLNFGTLNDLARKDLVRGLPSSGVVPNPTPTTPYVPPTYKELEILFQPMFDEYFKPLIVDRLNPRGIFINQSKYANETLKKFDLLKSDPIDTPMVERTNWYEVNLSGFPGGAELISKYSWMTDVSHSQQLPRERFEFILPRLGVKCMKLETLKRLQDEKNE
ncbi:retrovirus-related pol polyprotein from transposon TNT 1-94, partial [Tanacetum coccineum]